MGLSFKRRENICTKVEYINYLPDFSFWSDESKFNKIELETVDL